MRKFGLIVYGRGGGLGAQAAAQWVVDCANLAAAEGQWRRARQAAEEAAAKEAARAKAERARIFARFDLQVCAHGVCPL